MRGPGPRRAGLAAVPIVWAIFPVLHASHGAGFAVGLVSYALKPDWSTEPEPLEPLEEGKLREEAEPSRNGVSHNGAHRLDPQPA